MQMWPYDANYFGDKSELKTDQHFPLLHMIVQHTLDIGMYRHFQSLVNDYQNLSASLTKMRLFYANRDSKNYGICRCVQSEIEYLAVLCRSIFDLLQVLVRLHIERIRILDGPQPKKLPDSFREVIYKKKANLSVDEIVLRYGLPIPIANWYVQQCDFFMRLRAIRDRIVHRGSTVEVIFSTDRGFAVSRDDDPFDGLYDWPAECELPNSLVPIRPALATMVKNTMDACNTFATMLSATIAVPDELAPNLKLFTRGTNDQEFQTLDAAIIHSLWDDT
ncbi:MAG: hypothetical protein HY776_06445 [Actinobacteria bacterium]|nr:hypothetical protein [Actinomycetota bacterium]